MLNSQSQHGGRRRISEDDDEDCEADAYPAQGAVQAHIVGAYKGGLQDEKEQPRREDKGVQVNDMWRLDTRMEQILVDGKAKAVGDNNRNQQRHEEIKVAFQDTRSLYCHTLLQRLAGHLLLVVDLKR